MVMALPPGASVIRPPKAISCYQLIGKVEGRELRVECRNPDAECRPCGRLAAKIQAESIHASLVIIL